MAVHLTMAFCIYTLSAAAQSHTNMMLRTCGQQSMKQEGNKFHYVIPGELRDGVNLHLFLRASTFGIACCAACNITYKYDTVHLWSLKMQCRMKL